MMFYSLRADVSYFLACLHAGYMFLSVMLVYEYIHKPLSAPFGQLRVNSGHSSLNRDKLHVLGYGVN